MIPRVGTWEAKPVIPDRPQSVPHNLHVCLVCLLHTPSEFAKRQDAPVEACLKLFTFHWPTAAIKDKQLGPSHLRVCYDHAHFQLRVTLIRRLSGIVLQTPGNLLGWPRRTTAWRRLCVGNCFRCG